MCVIFFPKIMNNSIHMCFIISEIVYDIVKYVCANFGAFIAQFMIQRKIAWRPFLKEVATTDTDTGANSGTSIPENACKVHVYQFWCFYRKVHD